VTIGPRDAEALGNPLDVGGPGHRLRQRVERRARTARAVTPETLERIDAAVFVAPRDADGIPANEMNVLRCVRVGLTQEG